MRKITIIGTFAIACCFFANNTLKAQVVGEEDVDVVSGYNPVLADALKETVDASTPKTDVKPEEQTYNIPIEFYQIPYQPVKVKPIRMPDVKPEDLDQVYAKFGFGTQLSPLAEAYYNSQRSKKYNYGVYGRYISANGKTEFQQYSDARLGGGAKFFIDDKYALPVNASFSSNTLYYYGIDPVLDSALTEADLKQRFMNYGFDLGFHNTGDNPLNMDFGLKAGLNGLNDINKSKEINPFFSAWGEKKLENKSIAGTEFSFNYYSLNGISSYVNSLTSFKPYYKWITDQYSLIAGTNVTVDKQSNAFVLPDINFSYDLIGDKFVLVVGWDGHLQVNSYANIVAENPFVNDTLQFRNTPIQEIFGGLRGSTSGNFSFMVKGYQKITNDMPFYVNDTSDMKRFDIVYSDATMWGGTLELSYFDSDRFRATGSVNVFTFSELSSIEKPYHRPTLEWTMSGMYRLNHKLSMTADVFGVNKSYALLPLDETAEIKGAVDMNLSATYAYSKYFNIFVNVNNLANFKYQRYYNYPSYGIQAIAGLSFTF